MSETSQSLNYREVARLLICDKGDAVRRLLHLHCIGVDFASFGNKHLMIAEANRIKTKRKEDPVGFHFESTIRLADICEGRNELPPSPLIDEWFAQRDKPIASGKKPRKTSGTVGK